MTALVLNGPRKKKDKDMDINPGIAIHNGNKWNEKWKETTCNLKSTDLRDKDVCLLDLRRETSQPIITYSRGKKRKKICDQSFL